MIPIYVSGQFIGVMIALILAKYVNDFSVLPIVPESLEWTDLLREFAN